MTDIEPLTNDTPVIFQPKANDLDCTNIRTIEDWNTVANSLSAISDGWQWWAGSLLAYGEDAFGDEVYQFFGDKRADKTWLNAAWVCRQFPPETRFEDLSFSHHAIIAGPLFTPEWRQMLLTEALAEGWSVRDLKKEARNLLIANGVDPDVGKPQPPEAPDEPQPEIETVPADAAVALAEHGLGTPADAIHFMIHRTMPDLFGDNPTAVVDACDTLDDVDKLRVQAGAMFKYSQQLLAACMETIRSTGEGVV